MVKAVYKVLALSFMGIMTLTTPACQNSDDKVISYQEEVKLSDGSMIWVDIKRHYSWSGWTPGMGNSGAYLSGAVEISWDTGFPNVGRKTLAFDTTVYLIDKIDNKWYVMGNTYGMAGEFGRLHNCVTSGTYTPRMHISPICLVIINSQGKFEQLPKEASKEVVFNILDADAMKGEPIVSQSLDKKRLSWQEKLSIQAKLPEFTHNIGKPYQAYADPREYSNE